MITVKIENETALNMLVDRVEYWTDDAKVIELYCKMYESYIDSGCFDDSEFEIANIVDNDYINYTRIISQGDAEFDELLKVYDEQGMGDCSCETEICNYIEAVDDDCKPSMFLVR